ncbi:hypothetical protein [Streptomyces resistomycificus]|nr:hypothetical protein [Streptomyces resistomycificus]
MSFEEEWAQLKADALARQQTGMQIDPVSYTHRQVRSRSTATRTC